MEISDAGVNLIKGYEGLVDGNPKTVNLDPYMDPVGIWTIGWGHAIPYGKGLLTGRDKAPIIRQLYPDGITRADAVALLKSDIKAHARPVDAWVKVPLTQNQYDALVSLVFNIGPGNFQKSQVFARLNKGDYKGAAAAFLNHVKAKGRVLPGLVRRRKEESALFLKG
jgi:lysozyme